MNQSHKVNPHTRVYGIGRKDGKAGRFDERYYGGLGAEYQHDYDNGYCDGRAETEGRLAHDLVSGG